MIATLMRLYAYLFHLVLGLFLLGLALVALVSATNLHLDMLPWTGKELTNWLLIGSLLGLLSIALAVTGKFRFLFPLWNLIVLVMLVRGYLLQPYTFGGKDAFYQILWIIAGAFLAFLASLTLLRSPRRMRA